MSMFKCIDFGCGAVIFIFGLILAIFFMEMLAKSGF